MQSRKTKFKCFEHLDGALCENIPWYKKYHDSKFVNIVHTLLFVVFLFGIIGSISYTAYITDTKPAQAAAKTWTGLGDDVSCGTGNSFNWSCGANWSGGTVPVTGDAITFNNTSAKDAVLDAGFAADSILSLVIANTYTGTITLEKDLHVTGVFTQSGGTFDAGSYALDIDSNFTLSGTASFTAPSSTMNLGAGLNIANTTTFNHGGGTITFDGASQTLLCNNAGFNLVNLWNTATANLSDCQMNLGNNPTTLSIVLNSSTLVGTGELRMQGQLLFNTGSPSITGFTDFDFNSSLTINNGTFNAPPGTMNIAGHFNFNGGVFNHNNGTIVLDGTTQNFNCNGAGFYLVDLSMDVAAFKTFNNCDIPLGNNPTIGSGTSFQNNTIVSGTGTLTVSSSRSMTVGSGATFSGFTGLDRSSGGTLTINTDSDFSSYTTFIIDSLSLSSGILNLPDGADINTALAINGGTLNAPSGKIFIGGRLNFNNGTFNHNNGTLVFDDNSTQVIPCNIDYNLVDFAGDGMKMIGTSCVISIGNNPSLTNSGDIVLEGEIIGSGTLNRQGGALRLQGNNAKLSGFNNYNTSNIFVTNGILGHWIFDDETSKDVSGNNNHGTLGGGYNFDDNAISQEGRSIMFNGIDGYMATAKSSNLRPQFPFTISLWHKADNAADKVLMSSNTENGPGWVYDGFRVQISDAGLVGAGYGDGQGFQGPANRFSATVDTALIDNSWHHITAVYNGPQDISIYVDGVEQVIGSTGGGATSIGYFNNESILSVGRAWDTTPEPDDYTYYNVQLDDLRVYNTALGGADIETLASENPTLEKTQLNLSYPLNLSGNLALLGANLSSAGNPITLAGDWNNVNGNFIHENNTVSLVGENQNIFGDNTFYNLFKTNSGNLSFEAGKTQIIEDTLKLQGQEGDLLNLNSSIDGERWNINAANSEVSYVNAKDGNNLNPKPIIATYSVDGGNNINWTFYTGDIPEDEDDDEDSPEEPTNPNDNKDKEDDDAKTPNDPDNPDKPSDEDNPDDSSSDNDNDNDKGKDDKTVIQEIFSAQIFKDSLFYFMLFILMLTLIVWVIKREHDEYKHKKR